jgi:hypothetical protein
METKELFSTDYVIYNHKNNCFVRWDSDDDVVIYGDKEEALLDCRESEGEQVISCTDLPKESQQLIINQINNSVIIERIYALLDRVNNIINKYGGECKISNIDKYDNGVIYYSSFDILIQNESFSELNLYTNIAHKEGIPSYIDADIKIHKEEQLIKPYVKSEPIEDANLEKYIDDLIIEKLKSPIN